MKEYEKLTHLGRPVEELSREELIEAFYELYEDLQRERKRHEQTLGIMGKTLGIMGSITKRHQERK